VAVYAAAWETGRTRPIDETFEDVLADSNQV
jgi:hypothetical protein